ncbi:hypothetical protein DFH08DRAFT_900219 [Mycena albidolilacea]|uniref:Uncharacterized protein n=1 Tax=Mycena albidolilacea TaxID=1033008 RepID=A0AAD7EAW9_9AGAR|nr:hypothetical protein DFH08DRAFT_900219 [Mycena albidolilacea]
MPAMNNTIDDASPLIKYLPEDAWIQDVSEEAHMNTFTWTTSQNASATFQFWGTSITVKGLRNEWHGGYTVSLNGEDFHMNGSMPQQGKWQTPIFSRDDLPPGQYMLMISNDGQSALDIDSITWSCNIGGRNDTNSSLQNTTVDDTESAFSWFPPGSWGLNPSNLPMFSQETGHSTSQPNASVNYTFSGDAVAIYGTAGPGHSRYSVLPPGRPAQQFDAARDIFSSQVLMYFGDRFGPGNHTVTLVNEGPGLFQIDYAVVHTTNTLSTSVIPSPSPSGIAIPPDPDPINRGGLSAGVIVAIIFAALFFVFLIASLVFLLQRNKTLWYRLQRGYKVQSQFDAGTPPNGSVTPLPFSTPPPMRSKSYLLQRDDDDDDFEAQPLNRAVTMESHLTASTLVADAGSSRRPHSSLKVLRLASRWGSGTPASSTTHLSRTPSTPMRHSVSSRRFTLSPPTPHLHLSRQEESQYYDPHAATVAGLDEIPEDSIEEVLRHPIRRNEPSMSTYQHWQSGLP